MNEIISARIRALRDDMRQAGIDAAIIPQTDPHQSEYMSDHWQLRRWLSGFTGSAGDLVVTHTEAWLWADSRYWLQAAAQLADTPIAVMEEGKEAVPAIVEQLCKSLAEGTTVGVDGMLFPAERIRSMQKALAAKGIGLRADYDPADRIWPDRPSLPQDHAFIHETRYAGEDASEKITRILAAVEDAGADAIFIPDLAEIAWTLNMRAADVGCNPVVTSFLFLSNERRVLFIDRAKVTDELAAYFADNSIVVKDYAEATGFLRSLPEDCRVLTDGDRTAYALLEALGRRIVAAPSPIAMFKAVKNEVQIAGVRDAMVRDGAAMVHSLMAIERKMAAGEPLTELDVIKIINDNRRNTPLFFDLSFDTIVCFGPNSHPSFPSFY